MVSPGPEGDAARILWSRSSDVNTLGNPFQSLLSLLAGYPIPFAAVIYNSNDPKDSVDAVKVGIGHRLILNW